MTAGVRYLPWVQHVPVGDGLIVRVAGQDVAVPLTRLGPGDVVGIEPTQIVARVPAPNSTDFAPNLFPFVELRDPDFPWRVSTDAQPWLALLVQEIGRDQRLAQGAGALPVIEVDAAALPSVAAFACWCHAQVVGDAATALALQRGQGIARLVAPRRLAPHTRYVACLVPCRDAGRLAGLAQPIADPLSPAPAWTATGTVTLPVYDHWYFTTGEVGDFETLARRLQPEALAASEPPWSVDYASVAADAAPEALFTALVPPAHAPAERSVSAAGRLQAWLDATASSAAPPVLGPPLYGGLAAGTTRASAGWLADANLDPRARAAAAIGAEAVRRHQDDLVAEAWRQLGDLRRANRERDLALLGDAVVTRWKVKHLDPLTAEAMTVVAAPALARLRGPHGTLRRELTQSALPAALLSSRFRSLAATHGRATPAALTQIVTAASQRRATVDAIPPTPAGLTTAARLRDMLASTPPSPPTPLPAPPTPPVPPRPRPGRPLSDVLVPTAPSRPRPDTTNTTPPRTGPVALDPARGFRAEAIAAGVATLRARRFPERGVVRPRPLALAGFAETARTGLGRPRALTHHQARVERGAFVSAAVGTRPLVAEPEIDVPLVELVRGIDPRFLLASVTVPPDRVGLLTPNAAFIEAVLLGANDALIRELRWRGAHVAPRATPLRRFFDVRGRAQRPPPELPAVATWAAPSRLGTHLTSRDDSVLIIRGELVRRMTDALIYAAPARRTDGRRRPSDLASEWLEPTFRGQVTDDTLFVGFDRTPLELRAGGGEGWYVVIAERPGGPRFGLDEPAPRTEFRTWADLHWGDVALRGGYLDVAGTRPRPLSPGPWRWGDDAAHMAAITTQRPFRVAFHAADLLKGLA